MTFIRYPHLEKFGNTEVQDIDFGVCHIFPKLDGTNSSVWLEFKDPGPVIVCGSRNRQLNWKLSTPETSLTEGDNASDNQGFAAYIREQPNIHKFLLDVHNIILYGEFLIPHTIKDYRDEAWKKFYVFDVWNTKEERFLPYEEYRPILEQYQIAYIPCFKVIKNPSWENLMYEAKNSNFLMKDGCVGEGIVIKNYEWKNKFGHQPWAKIINQEFKDTHTSASKPGTIENHTAAQQIADKACTTALIDKEFAKIVSENNGWNSKFIPRLLHTVYYCVVTEELWNCLKMVGRGSVNFQELQSHCIGKIKAHKPELF